MKTLELSGLTGPKVRVVLYSSSTGGGLTGLTNTSSGLIVAVIADNAASTNAYTSAGSTIDTIATLGTWAAPTTGHCRFKEVDSTNHPGLYELQFSASLWSIANAGKLVVTIQVTGGNMINAEIQLTGYDFGTAYAVSSVAGNVAGSVASVTGNVGGNVVGSVASVVGNVGGNVTGSVGSIQGITFPTNFAALGITSLGKIAEVVLADTLTTYTGNTPQTGDAFARIGSNGSGLTSVALASSGLDAITVETGVNARQALSPILAASAGVLSGAGTGTIVIKGGNVATTRITATTDSTGNRSAVTLALPS